MTGVEINRAIEDGRKAARDYIKNHGKQKDNRKDPNNPQERDGGLTSLDKEDFIKNGPSKYSPPKGNGDNKNDDSQQDDGQQGNDGQGNNPVNPGKGPGGDPGSVQKGKVGKGTQDPNGKPATPVSPVFKQFIPDEGEPGEPTEDEGDGEPNPENKDHNEDDHKAGKGEVRVDSLCGREIYNHIQEAIAKAKASGDDFFGIENVGDQIPNQSVSESDRREMMRKLIQSGIDNGNLTNNQPISKDNPLSIDPSRYTSFPFLDWRKVLDDFLSKVDVEWESNWYGSPYKHADFAYDQAWRDEYPEIQESVAHIVISVDTSGSVSEEKISLFLNQVGEVLDSAINDDVLVDVVKCAYSNLTIDRFMHHKGEFASEAHIIRQNGERGGTDYTNPLKYFHYMMMDDDDRKKNGFDEFMSAVVPDGIHVVDETVLDNDMIPPASGFVLFTDGDYFSCDKYYGTMEAESAPFEDFVARTCFFVGLDNYDVRVGNTDMWGHPYERDKIFGHRTYICSMKMFWDKYVGRKINESIEDNTLLEMAIKRRNIVGSAVPVGSTPDTDNKVAQQAQQDDDINVSDLVKKAGNRTKIDFTANNVSLLSAIDAMGVEYSVTKSDGIIHLNGDQDFGDDIMDALAGVHGDVVYTVDGTIGVSGANCSFIIKHPPMKESRGQFAIRDNRTITYDNYRNSILNQGLGHLVKYVNCSNITAGLSAEYIADGDAFGMYHAFSNDANLTIDYVKKYVEVVKSAKSIPEMYKNYEIYIASIDKNGYVSDRVKYNGQPLEPDALICIRPVEDYDGGGIMDDAALMIYVPGAANPVLIL